MPADLLLEHAVAEGGAPAGAPRGKRSDVEAGRTPGPFSTEVRLALAETHISHLQALLASKSQSLEELQQAHEVRAAEISTCLRQAAKMRDLESALTQAQSEKARMESELMQLRNKAFELERSTSMMMEEKTRRAQLIEDLEAQLHTALAQCETARPTQNELGVLSADQRTYDQAPAAAKSTRAETPTTVTSPAEAKGSRVGAVAVAVARAAWWGVKVLGEAIADEDESEKPKAE